MKWAKTSVFLVAVLGLSWALCGRAWAADCMVGYWRLDEGAGATAYDSANGNDGIIYGASWTTGMIGQALNFNGDGDYINVGSGSDLTSLTPAGMTIEAWVYSTRTISATGVDLRTVIAQRDRLQNNGYGLQYGYITGYEVNDYCVTILFFGGYQGVVSGYDYEILTGEWYHIVAVFEDNNATIYINGTVQPTRMISSGYTPSTDDVMIGRHGNYYPGPAYYYHEGIIDEVAVYNCALSAAKIWQHYENGLNGIGYLAIEVEIDIKPGSDPNPINPGSNGLVPVAILTTADFDAADVDPATVALAGRGVALRGKAEKLMARLEDVDGDGDNDLVVQVETNVSEGDIWESGTVELTGETYGGQAIVGYDDVIVVPPE